MLTISSAQLSTMSLDSVLALMQSMGISTEGVEDRASAALTRLMEHATSID